MTQYQNRGFPRDSPGCPVNVLIQDQIAPYRDFFLRKTVDDRYEALLVFFHRTFVKDFYQIRPKRSMPRNNTVSWLYNLMEDITKSNIIRILGVYSIKNQDADVYNCT